jgi:hypothetical protein
MMVRHTGLGLSVAPDAHQAGRVPGDWLATPVKGFELILVWQTSVFRTQAGNAEVAVVWLALRLFQIGVCASAGSRTRSMERPLGVVGAQFRLP